MTVSLVITSLLFSFKGCYIFASRFQDGLISYQIVCRSEENSQTYLWDIRRFLVVLCWTDNLPYYCQMFPAHGDLSTTLMVPGNLTLKVDLALFAWHRQPYTIKVINAQGIKLTLSWKSHHDWGKNVFAITSVHHLEIIVFILPNKILWLYIKHCWIGFRWQMVLAGSIRMYSRLLTNLPVYAQFSVTLCKSSLPKLLELQVTLCLTIRT